MTANEAFILIQMSIAKIDVIACAMKLEENISDEAIEQYRLCMQILRKMGKLAEQLIENSDKIKEILLRGNK